MIIIRNSQEKIICFLVALTGYICLEPYFIWTGFSGWNINISGFFQLLCFIGYVSYRIVIKRKITFTTRQLSLVFFLLIVGVVLYLLNGRGIDFYPARMLPVFSISILIFMSDKERKQTFSFFAKIFAISLIFGEIYYILNILGVNPPYEIIQAKNTLKSEAGQNYKHYFGAIIIASDYSSVFPRLCGTFDEPGVVGTFAALILTATQFKFKKEYWYNYVILIGGMMSLSLAFFALSIIGFVLLLILRIDKRWMKSLLTFACVVVVAYIIFPSAFDYFTDRFSGERVSSIMDTRITNQDSFDAEMKAFWQGDLSEVLLGKGFYASMQNSNMSGSYTYKMPIYDHGIIGMGVAAIWIIWLFYSLVKSLKFNESKKLGIILFVVFLASFLQRPYILTLPFFVIAICGIAHIKYIDDGS